MKVALVDFGAFVLIATQGAAAYAYEPVTHSDLSAAAANRSVLAEPRKMWRLGMQNLPIGLQQSKFPNSKGESLSPIDLVRFGAEWEDNRGAFQATRHFYNPVDGSKLLPVLGDTSPDWALEDRGLKDGQAYSYRMMRRYYLNALTGLTIDDRNYHWGLTFQSLGHVVHHLQDMAQPQHVRGDAHCDATIPCAFPGLFLGYYSPSIFEKRVERNPPQFGNYAPVYADGKSSDFYLPRKFWHTNEPGGHESGRGIAEFTNRSFVSSGTNFDSSGAFALSAFDESIKTEIPVSALCEASPGACGTPSLSGVVTFYGNVIIDHLTGEKILNPRMTSKSIFDSALSRHVGKRVFSYNKFNADAAAAILVPRAVGYSAGLINYFFRVDFDLVSQSQTGWYRIQNNSSEPMDGRFRVYFDDATGKRRLAQGAEWRLRISPNGQSELIFLDPSAESWVDGRKSLILVFDGIQGEEMPFAGGVGAVGGLATSNCLVVLGQKFSDGPVTVTDPATRSEYLVESAVGAEYAKPEQEVWILNVAGRSFRLEIAPWVSQVYVGLPGERASTAMVRLLDDRGAALGPQNDVSYQLFLLPDSVWSPAERMYVLPDGSRASNVAMRMERPCG